MNLFFGTVGEARSAARERIAAHCAERHGLAPVFHDFDRGFLGHAGGGGRVLGRAERDGHLLVFNGSFFEPFPGGSPGAALEDPDRAAAVLLERYLELGTGFLDGLVGYYSLAVRDRRDGALHLATDPYGQRTLFVHRDGGALTFASNLAAAAMLLEAPAIARDQEDFFLVYGFFPHGGTPFAGLVAASPGRLLTWRPGGLEERRIAPFEPAAAELAPGAPMDEAIEVLYRGFMEALEQQCGRLADAGVLLGGFDSALVAAGLARLGKRVSTWSFHYREEEYNQPHTGDVSAFLGSVHHWVHVTRSDVESGLVRFPHVFNQPSNWPNYVLQTALVCERMRDAGVPLAYSGDGCDTVFLGYPGTWRRARVLERVPELPEWLAALGTRLAARPVLERRLGHPYRVLLNLVRTSSWPRHARGFLSFRLLDEISLDQLRGDDRPPQRAGIRETVEELARPHRGLPTLRLAYLGKGLISPNKNKMNGSSDVSGIPILSPYMHPSFKRLAQSLPEELCRPHETTRSRVTGKYVLMRMAEEKGLLPPAVIYQKKMAAVDAPIDRWYAGPLRGFLKAQMESLPFAADPGYLDALLEPRLAETFFQKRFLVDKIIKQAPSLLATYAGFCALAGSRAAARQDEDVARKQRAQPPE